MRSKGRVSGKVSKSGGSDYAFGGSSRTPRLCRPPMPRSQPNGLRMVVRFIDRNRYSALALVGAALQLTCTCGFLPIPEASLVDRTSSRCG